MTRMTTKDRALMKQAARRAFARSDLHREVKEASFIQHHDPSRPKVKQWARCNVCKKPEAKSYVEVDHIVPWVPLNSSWEDWVLEIGLTAAIDLLWCDKSNLQVICPECHDRKSAAEKEQRKVLCPKKPRAPRKKKTCAKT